jgi:UDP-2,3-diacylglucosamine pyrophosphatase LpxH
MKPEFIFISSALLLWASLAFADPNGTGVDPNLNATAKPDHIVLTWSDDPATTQTVSFRTAPGVAAGSVVYWQEGKGQSESVPRAAAATTFHTDVTDPVQGSCLLWTVTLTDLEPMTRYSYSVKTEVASSAVYFFTTGPSAASPVPFKFLVFGDSQSGDPLKPDYSVWQDTVSVAYARNPDARFLMNIGDLVEVGQSIVHWNNWLSAAQDVIAHIPEMPVQGNHETYVDANEKRTVRPTYLTSQFRVFANGPEGLCGQTYSFDHGDAHMVVVDSQEDEEAKIAGPVLPKQAVWLASDLEHSAKTWKLVFFHKTPFYNKAVRANELLKSAIGSVCESHSVDLVFNGHDHGLSRTYPIKNNRLMSRPADGTVYYVAGRSGAKTYNDLTRKVWDAFFYDPQDQSCYLTVQIDGPRLTVNAFKADGTPLDSYTIDKKDPSACTMTPAPARFNRTRTVVYGDYLPGQAINSKSASAAQDSKGTWFVDARAFMTYLGGAVSYQDGITWLFLGSKSYAVPSDQVQFNADKVLTLSTEAIHDLLGFQYRYDDALNAIFFVKLENE